jgi:hypothetical protein
MAGPTGHAKGWETRRQKDELAAQNIAPEDQALYNKVKGSLKGKTPHAKYEAFEHYKHDHPGEALAAAQSHADSKLDALVAQRNASNPASASMSMSELYASYQDPDVPF